MIKKFENFIERPKIGDYVLIHFENSQRHYFEDNDFINFINNNIGIITGIFKNDVTIQYSKVPEKYRKKYFVTSDWDDRHNIITFYVDQILAFGSSPEEVKIKANANKYGI